MPAFLCKASKGYWKFVSYFFISSFFCLFLYDGKLIRKHKRKRNKTCSEKYISNVMRAVNGNNGPNGLGLRILWNDLYVTMSTSLFVILLAIYMLVMYVCEIKVEGHRILFPVSLTTGLCLQTYLTNYISKKKKNNKWKQNPT